MTRTRRRYSGKQTEAVLRDGRWLSLGASGLLQMIEARMVYRDGGDIVPWLRPARPLRPGEVVGSIRQWAQQLDEGRGRVERALSELRRPAPDGQPYLTALEQHTRHGTLYRVERFPEDWGHSSHRRDKRRGDSSHGQDKTGADLSQKRPYSSRKGEDSTRGYDEKGSIGHTGEPPFNRVITNNPLHGGAGPERLQGSAPASDNGSSLEAVLRDLKQLDWPTTVEGAVSIAERVGKAAGRGMQHILALVCDSRRAAPGRRWAEFERKVDAKAEASSAGMDEAERCLRAGVQASTGR